MTSWHEYHQYSLENGGMDDDDTPPQESETMNEHESKCELCGEPMPQGEEMFKLHGYSGPCPKPPLPKTKSSFDEAVAMLEQAVIEWRNCPNVGDKPLDVACHFMEQTLPEVIAKLKSNETKS